MDARRRRRRARRRPARGRARQGLPQGRDAPDDPDRAARATTRSRRGSSGLRPHERYYYRFETATRNSPVGRFQTALPEDSNEPVRLGFFSCQNYPHGYYNAHDADGARGPRLRRQPRRLHLRRGLPLARGRHRRARRPHRPPARGRDPRGDLARRLPRQVQALPQGPERCGRCTRASRWSRPGTTTRPRTTTPAGRPAAACRREQRFTEARRRARLQGVLRAHAALRGAARPRPPLPHAALRPQRRPDHARRAPVPRRPAVRRRRRRRPAPSTTTRARCSARARRRSSRPRSSSRRRPGS